jgi:hypothetical protein
VKAIEAVAVAVLTLAIENARGLLVVVGAAWLYHGLAGFSVPAANVVGGVLVMAVGAYPYLLRKRKA